MTVLARAYQAGDAAAWDDLVLRSATGTLLHTRRYLSYHGERFDDQSLVLCDAERDQELVGVFPAALDVDDPHTVVSHPGITYGGLVSAGALTGDVALDALRAVIDAYRARDLRSLVYKPVPAIFHRRTEADDLYALFRLGGAWSRSDLACFVDLASRRPPSRGRAGAIRKAHALGLEIASGRPELAEFWPILTAVLRNRHAALPTHSLAEMEHLAVLFPEEIDCLVARHDGRVVAGAVVYATPTCLHTQYLAATPEGRALSALDLVIETVIARAAAAAKRHVSLGTSTEDEGRMLNTGLHGYKASFGASTITFDRYALPLSRQIS